MSQIKLKGDNIMTIQTISRTMTTNACTFGESIGNTMMTSCLDWCTKNEKDKGKLMNNIEWLVIEEKAKDFYGLDDEEKLELTGLFLSAMDDQFEWLAECDGCGEAMRAFAKSMKTQSPEDKEYFLSVMQANAVKYFSPHLNDLVVSQYYTHQRELREHREIEAMHSSLQDPF